MTDGWPRDARVSDADREIYTELIKSSDSPFEDWERNQLFIFAASYANDNGLRTALDGTSHALFNWQSLSNSQRWVIKSIAVAETESPDILDAGSEIDEITREFATGGINGLYRMYNSPEKEILTRLSEEVIQKAKD